MADGTDQLRDHGAARGWRPAYANRLVAFGALALLVLLLLAWAPTPAARNVITTPILIAMAIIGLEALRRQTVREFPARQGAPSDPQAS